MDALRENDGELTEAEIAYFNSGGQTPLPSEPEPEAREPEPAAEPEAQPEPEAQAAEETDPEVIEDGDETHKGRKVGYSAYLRKKAEADAARKEREELRERLATSERERAVENARIEERFRQFQEMQQRQAVQAQAQPQQQPAQPPDRNEDPLGYMAWQDERLNRLEQFTTQSAEQQRQARAIAQLDDTYRRDNHQAAREVPEFIDAYNFMVQRGAQIIASRNPQWSADQVKAAVEHEERQIAAAALQSGERPAARVLRMSMAYGWTPQMQGQQPAQNAQPAQPDPAAEQAKLDAVARGQAQNRSLSATGRPGTSTATMTLERFLSLSDDEAREWGQKNPREFERLAGGR